MIELPFPRESITFLAGKIQDLKDMILQMEKSMEDVEYCLYLQQ